MIINRVTITGGDDNTNIEDLKTLSIKYSFVEWGILFSRSSAGRNRFPTTTWVGELLSSTYTFNLSAHLCGVYAREFMLGKNNFVKDEFFNKHFKRFQLNFNFQTSGLFDLPKVEEIINSLPENNFIFQLNKANESFIKHNFFHEGKYMANVNILFDSSGGRGNVIKDIKTPLHVYTGYSGGLRGDNIDEICKKIISFPNNSEVWIDVESGVRTEDKLDIDKVDKFLSICSNYI